MLLLLASLLAGPLQAQIRPGYNVSGVEEPTPVVTRLFVPVYTKFQSQFESFCFEVWRDGRYDRLVEILDANIFKDPECTACRPLFSSMLAACKAQRVRESKRVEKEKKLKYSKWKAEQARQPKEEKEAEVKSSDKAEDGEEEGEPTPTPGPPPEPTPTPLYPQREPRAEVIAAASDAFEAIFAIEKGREESLKAVKRITGIFHRAEGFTPAEKNYFGTLVGYIYAPFKEFEESLPRDSLDAADFGEEPDGSNAPPPLDDFFGS